MSSASGSPCGKKRMTMFLMPAVTQGMFRRSASLAIPHRKSFAAIPSLSLGSLGTRIAASNCHTSRSVKLPSFRHFQDQFLTTNKEEWGKKSRPVFRRVCVFDVSRAVGIARFESVSEPQPHRTIQGHYRFILNYYPINSKTILWGNSEITPLEINSLMIRFFEVIFYPPKHWSIHIMRHRITPHD